MLTLSLFQEQTDQQELPCQMSPLPEYKTLPANIIKIQQLIQLHVI